MTTVVDLLPAFLTSSLVAPTHPLAVHHHLRNDNSNILSLSCPRQVVSPLAVDKNPDKGFQKPLIVTEFC